LKQLDLMIRDGGRRIGFEFKYSQAPIPTKSMHSAMADLDLDRLIVVHPGDRAFPLAPKIEAIPLQALNQAL
jgi:uncharacterized protein